MTTEITTADLLNPAILPNWPRPADAYQRALWAENLETAASDLAALFNREYHTTISHIIKNHITSPQFELCTPETTARRVNIERLRTEAAKIYETVVYIAPVDAARILGRRTLYQLCRQHDTERTDLCARANVGDLEKILKPTEMEPYLIIDKKQNRPKIISRETP